MQTIMMTSTFPKRLKSILEETGMRQTDLCDKTGIGKSAMSQYIHGAFIPKQKKLSAIAEALDVSEAWLMGYDVPRFPKESCFKDVAIDSENCLEQYIKITMQDNSMESAYIPKGAKVYLTPLSKGLMLLTEEGCFVNGTIVGVSENDEKIYLRFMHQEGECIVLTAADPKWLPKIFDKKDLENGKLQIRGVVDKVEIKF